MENEEGGSKRGGGSGEGPSTHATYFTRCVFQTRGVRCVWIENEERRGEGYDNTCF